MSTKKRDENRISIKSDALFKSVMESEIAAKEFLEEYLPTAFKELVDLSTIKVEKESYVEEDLKKQLSDIVYSVRTKTDEKAYIYSLIEHQSISDHWIALRLWRYSLLLIERHRKGKKKLPLVAPLVFYNGKKKYTAPKSLWELFENPKMAKSLMGDEYRLIDLQSMSNDKIKKERHLSIIEFFMKNIHQRDMLKLWEQFFNDFHEAVLIDKENGYIYIKKLIWYTDSKVAEENKDQLNKLILRHLPKDEGEEIMRTIADGYFEKGIEQGIKKGIKKGITQVVLNMLEQKLDLKLIASATGLSLDDILKLKSKTQLAG